MDVGLEYELLDQWSRQPFLILQISLLNHPDVTPVIQGISPTIACPMQHSSLTTIGTPKATLLEYDVTMATVSSYLLNDIEIYPTNCFQSTAVYFVDDSGVVADYATFSGTALSIGEIADLNQFQIDKAGVKEWSWLQSPVTLHWTAELAGGDIVNDIMVLTIQGVSICSTSSFGIADFVQF